MTVNHVVGELKSTHSIHYAYGIIAHMFVRSFTILSVRSWLVLLLSRFSEPKLLLLLTRPSAIKTRFSLCSFLSLLLLCGMANAHHTSYRKYFCSALAGRALSSSPHIETHRLLLLCPDSLTAKVHLSFKSPSVFPFLRFFLTIFLRSSGPSWSLFFLLFSSFFLFSAFFESYMNVHKS